MRTKWEYYAKGLKHLASVVAGLNRGAKVLVGDYGTAVSGLFSTSIAGYGGKAIAGDVGTASAGDGGKAIAGHFGMALAGDGGKAIAGNHGTAIAGHTGEAVVGNGGTAVVGPMGTAIADRDGTAEAGIEGKAKVGRGGVLILWWADANLVPGRYICRKSVGQVDLDGKGPLKPDTWYQVDNQGNFVEAPD